MTSETLHPSTFVRPASTAWDAHCATCAVCRGTREQESFELEDHCGAEARALWLAVIAEWQAIGWLGAQLAAESALRVHADPSRHQPDCKLDEHCRCVIVLNP